MEGGPGRQKPEPCHEGPGGAGLGRHVEVFAPRKRARGAAGRRRSVEVARSISTVHGR